MKKFLPVLLLVAAPVSLALAQTQLVPKDVKGATKGAVARADDCAPIGRTAKGELVYSMKCENVPAPPPPPPQAEVKEAPPPEPEVQRSGLFGWSYDRRKGD
ncbi:hypothetical protein [Bradyrhizobium sp. Ai1a-2]|uniref:hypothetical protein n=1 Tax=Bradyrhizobium sp. Ai1a-2 TaxID=196490 RepID=UPI0004026829|nr:hypothetical protein [Bradyrhizobium sp. Ai1a-2]